MGLVMGMTEEEYMRRLSKQCKDDEHWIIKERHEYMSIDPDKPDYIEYIPVCLICDEVVSIENEDWEYERQEKQ